MSELSIEARLEKELDDTLRKWTAAADEVTEIKRVLRNVEARARSLEQTALRQRMALFALKGAQADEDKANRYNSDRCKELRKDEAS